MTQLAKATWQGHDGLVTLLAALGAGQGDTRLVGGFVRDRLLGIETADIDCATRLQPDAVIQRIRDAGFKAIPTGIAHGTITALLPSGPIEITTLRKDVSTDGRRATIAYTDDWREDAARRDFTINALSVDPTDGMVHDYFDGLADLETGIVRFIGDPLARIAEDHLRILRFFRFQARFGHGAPDCAALDACSARANDLMALSRERIADELLKLLTLPDPVATVRLMVDRGIFRPILPEIEADGVMRLAQLVETERQAGIAAAPLRRMMALLPSNDAVLQAIGARFKLSNAARKRLTASAGPADHEAPSALAYRIGREAAIDRLLLAGHPAVAAQLLTLEIPRLPVSGGALVGRGVSAGPEVAALLKSIEDQWVAEGFPPADRVDAIIDAVLARR